MKYTVVFALVAAALAQGCQVSTAPAALPPWARLLKTETECEETFVACVEDGDEDCVEDLDSCLDPDPYNGLFGDLAACDDALHTCLDAIYSQVEEDEPCDSDDTGTTSAPCATDPEAAFEEEEEACFQAYDECYDPMACRLQDIEVLGECYAEFYGDPELGSCFQTLDECLLDIVADDPYISDEEVASREVGCFADFDGCAGIVLPGSAEHEECAEDLAECVEAVNSDSTLSEDAVEDAEDACEVVYDYCLDCGPDETDCDES